MYRRFVKAFVRRALEAEKQARAPFVNSVMVWLRLPPVTIVEVEAERDLYAFRPTRSEVVRQLVSDGLAFRQMFRPRSVLRRMNRLRRGLPEKPGKGVPFKFSFED